MLTDVIMNTTIVYADGITESFEALRETRNGVIFGRIIDGEFLDCGFISEKNIKEIKK